MTAQGATLAWRNGEPTTGVALNTISHTYQLTVRSSDPNGAASAPSAIDLRNGVVTLDGLTLSNPKMGNYFLSWGQRTPQGHSFGRLQVSKDRLWVSGTIGSSVGNGAPSVFSVIGVAESQTAQQPGGGNLTFQYEPDPDHPGRVVPSVQVNGTKLSGELRTTLRADGGLDLEHDDLPSHDLPSKVSLVSPSNGATPHATAAARASAAGTDCQSHMSPANLALQNIEDIEADSQAAFVQNLAWALEPGWAQAFLPNQTGFSSDANRIGLVDQDAEWYNATYAPAFLGSALNNILPSGSKLTLNPQKVNNLKYFLYEDLACDSSYIRQSNVAMIPAAIAATASACPGLGDYLSDTTHPAGYWPSQLLAYLTSQAQLQSVYNAAPDASGNLQVQELQNVMQTVNTNATLLTILDPSGSYAEQYYDAVYAAVFGGLLQNVTVSQDATFYQTWLEAFLTGFINYYSANINSQPAAGSPAAAQWSAGQIFNTAANAAGGVDSLALSISQAFGTTSPSTSLHDITNNAVLRFEQQYAGNADVQASEKYFLVIATAGLFINGLAGLKNLASLDPVDLANAVNNLVGLAAGLMSSLPDILSLGTWIYKDAQLFLAIAESGIIDDLAATTKLVTGAGATAVNLVKWMKQYVTVSSSGAESINAAAATSFATIVKNVATVGTYVGAVAAVIGFGFAVWQLEADIAGGAGALTLALDVASAAFAFAAAAASIAAILVESIIPAIIGAVAAIGGVVVGFIAQLFQEEPPPNPVEQYMQYVTAPFAAALPNAPNGWIPPSPPTSTSAVGAKVAARLAAFAAAPAIPRAATA